MDNLQASGINVPAVRKFRSGVSLEWGGVEAADFLSDSKLPEPGHGALGDFYCKRRNAL